MRQMWPKNSAGRKKKGGGAVILRPIRFQCAGDWISTGLPRTDIRIYTQLTTRKFNSEFCKTSS